MYYTGLLLNKKSVRIKDICKVIAKDGKYGVKSIKIYVDSRKIFTVDDSYAGYNLLIKRLKNENIPFVDAPVKNN